MDRVRALGVALLACAALIVVGTFNHSWFTRSGVGLGPLGIVACFDSGNCVGVGWTWAGDRIHALGTLVVGAGGAAVIVPLAIGVLAVAGRRDKLPRARFAYGALAAAALAGVAFAVVVLGDDDVAKGMSISWGAFPCVVGLLAAAAIVRALVTRAAPPPAVSLPPTQPTGPHAQP